MITRAGRWFLACLVAACVPSCLLAQPPDAHVAAPVEPDFFCARYAVTTCDAVDRCCTDPMLHGPDWNRDACVDSVQTSCAMGDFSISRVVRDPRTGYDPVLGGVALGTIERYAASCDPSIVEWISRRDGFFGPLRGTVANGEECLMGQDPITNFPAFLSCEDVGQSCILSDFTHGNCNARRTMGGSCVTDFDCLEPFYCTSGIGGTCQPRLALGADCHTADGNDHSNWCESHFCLDGTCQVPTSSPVYCHGFGI